MTMETYWDLTDAERGALSSAEVERYVDAELMLKGVLKVRPLAVETEPDMPKPARPVFMVRCGSNRYDQVDVAFASMEDARDFIACKPLMICTTYAGGSSVRYVKPIDNTEIVESREFTEEEKDAHKAALEKGNAIRAANETRRREHETAVRKQDEALKGLWEDWARCRDKRLKLTEVSETFAEYQRLAGNDVTAARFLEKVYERELIAEAAEAFGFVVPNTTEEAAE